jgi:hypothetical protein
MMTKQPSRSERLEPRLLCRGFLPAESYDSDEVTYAAPLDYDADGQTDLAAISSQGALHLFRGSGAGRLEPAQRVAIGDHLREVVAADFTGDGRPDLVVLEGSTNQAQLLANNGNGTFAAPVPIGSASVTLLSADFNNDGRPDLAAPLGEGGATGGAEPRALVIRLGNGDGTFADGIPVPATQRTWSAAPADFNADGVPDLAVAHGQGERTLSVRFGNGDGTFRAGPDLPAEFVDPDLVFGVARVVATGDFNGDARADVVAAVERGFRVYPGNGDGTFAPSILHKRRQSYDLATGDFNGDGITDLATTPAWRFIRHGRPQRWRAMAYLGRPSGRLRSIERIGDNFLFDRVITADLNADGRSDLIILREEPNRMRVALAEPVQ